jgi:hypothetical protein
MNIKKVTLDFLPYVIVMLGFLFAFYLVGSSRQTTRENNFYTRFQACVLTVAPSARTAESINSCYDQVEQQTGIKADRYKVQGFQK